MKLAAIHFRKVADGSKNIESRLYDEKRQKISIGDQIEFTYKDNPSQKILTKVKAIYLYSSFEELFSDFPLKKFGGNSKEELVEKVNKFYSKEEQERYDAVGIKIELVK